MVPTISANQLVEVEYMKDLYPLSLELHCFWFILIGSSWFPICFLPYKDIFLLTTYLRDTGMFWTEAVFHVLRQSHDQYSINCPQESFLCYFPLQFSLHHNGIWGLSEASIKRGLTNILGQIYYFSAAPPLQIQSVMSILWAMGL